MTIIDTHNHLYFPGFQPDFSAVLAQAQAAKVTQQILVGIDELSCQAALNLAHKHKDFKVSLGLHPCDVDQIGTYNPHHHQYIGLPASVRPQLSTLNEFISWIDDLAGQHPSTVVAFGETGFDQYHQQSEKLLERQTQSFKAHVDLCEKHDKTLIIHSRGAPQATLNFFKTHAAQFKHVRFVWHCFSEDENALKATLELGGYIGLGGIITYPKSAPLREILRWCPLEKMLTETDAPFLPPHQARKQHKLNQPAFLPEIIETIAEIKNVSPKKCEAQLFKNAQTAFKLFN